MRLWRAITSLEALMWFGLLGAPAAWTAQLLAGYGLAEASCSEAATRWSIAVDGLTIAVTAVAAVLAVLAWVAAFVTYGRTSPVAGVGGSEEPPPKGRIHFLAVAGMFITPLFFAMILMSGFGSVLLDNCVQS